jgi:hypothetical protein
MKYQCKVVIKGDLQEVTDLFLEDQVFCKAKAPGTKTSFNYKIGNEDVVMTETIESNDMPNAIVTIYEVPGVWNRCENRFTEANGAVTWTMDSEFRFEHEVNPQEEAFINKTQKSMEDFKRLVESKKR